MAEKQITSYEYYRGFARRMLLDIDLMQSDCQYVRSGGRISFAADFSEIYGYCMSASDSFLSKQELGLTGPQSGSTIISELHDAIMLFYLFEASEPLWLLDPYIVELRSFLRGISKGEFRNLVSNAGDALRQIRLASQRDDFLELSALARRKRESGDDLTQAESDRLFRFLEEVAPAVLQVHDSKDPNASPADRLRRLLREGRLLVPSDIPENVQRGQRDVYERWLAKLSRRRENKDATNASDALAAGVLFKLNASLSTQLRPRKVVLLTRSNVMHEIMRSEAAQGLWDGAGGNCMRHPRGVLALFDNAGEIVASDDPDRQMTVLQRWSTKFESIARTETKNLRRNSKLTPTEIMNRHMAVITEVWRRYCAVKAAKLTLERNYIQKETHLAALSTLVEPERIKTSVRKRLNELEFSLSGSHFVFATLASAEVADAARDLGSFEAAPAPWRFPEAVGDWAIGSDNLCQLYAAHKTPLPFRISIGDNRIRNVLKSEGRDPFVTLSVLAEEHMLEARASAEGTKIAELEWYLGMGYVCAAIGAWGAALKASTFILQELEPKNLEATLLYAKAVRNKGDAIDDLIGAEQRLSEAIDLPSAAPSTLLRFHSETIKYQFIVALRFIELGKTEAALPRINKIRDNIDEMIDRCEQCPISPEGCEYRNNVLYHLTVLRGLESDFVSWRIIDDLHTKQRTVLSQVYGGDWRQWPDNFVDTLFWVRLLLLRADALSEGGARILDEIVLALNTISSREHISNVDISDFRRHAEEAQIHITRANRKGF